MGRSIVAAAAMVLSLPIAACTTSGVSSFGDLKTANTASDQAAAEKIALASLAAEDDAAVASIDPAAGALKQNAGAATLDLAYAADPAEQAATRRAEALYARIEHGQCKAGWGPKPQMVNARRVDPAHQFYMEMRLRHTPPLLIGHVYIAYGRIGPDGNPLDERLVMLAPVGGYAGAAMASAVPMPGLVTPHPDDCVVKPIAAYYRSLSATDYEKLLLAIEQAKNDVPKYSLFTYNCNMFMSDIAKSVGILPPENIYQPSLVYFYEMMDRNEGRKVPRAPDFDAQVAALKAAPAN
jgi:hypothetical protein